LPPCWERLAAVSEDKLCEFFAGIGCAGFEPVHANA
jgi:hypothetical protein